MFGWLRKIWDRRPLRPESEWQLSFDGRIFKGIDQTGRQFSSGTEDVWSIKIETNDSGPWGADVWFLMFDRDENLTFGFPQGATGEQEILDWIFALDGCDHGEISRAMGCTDNAIFQIWARNK